jgi:hypothetical protein
LGTVRPACWLSTAGLFDASKSEPIFLGGPESSVQQRLLAREIFAQLAYVFLSRELSGWRVLQFPPPALW